MAKRFYLIVICIQIFVATHSFSVYAQDTSYETYLSVAYDAFDNGENKKAVYFFQKAYQADPTQQEPLYYINLIKRISDERLQDVDMAEVYEFEQEVIQKTGSVPNAPLRQPAPEPPPPSIYYSEPAAQKAASYPVSEKPSAPAKVPPLKEPKMEKLSQKESTYSEKQVVDLDDDFFTRQPNTELQIELKTFIVLRDTQDIKQFLVIDPNIFDVARLGPRELKVVPKSRGSTFLHVWDDRGRWTFNLKGTIPLPKNQQGKEGYEEPREEHVKPFVVSYSNTWDSYYRGDNMPDLNRQSLNFTQWVGLAGDTPYGHFYASANSQMFDQSTEIVGKSVGLVDGTIGPFKDFTIRGYDTSAVFSPLSLPGRFFRGVLLDAYAFNRNIHYKVLRGQDRATFTILTPGVAELEESYLEAASVTLYPDGNHTYMFNYARGFGASRPENLKSKVFSIYTTHQFDDLFVKGELAYDEDTFARTAMAEWDKENYTLNVKFRDIEKDFTTITGNPADQGEVGGTFLWEWTPNDDHFSSYLDVYRDKQYYNEDNPYAANFDWSLTYSHPFSPSTRLNSYAYVSYSPQLISPSRSMRFNSTLSQSFHLLQNRLLTTFLGGTVQSSRYDDNPDSEFDRYSILVGMRLPLIRNLYYYANYDYSWAHDVQEKSTSKPSVLNTGFSYNHRITNNLSGDMSITYRDEQEAGADFSFLSGTDSLGISLGLTYRPKPDLEIFMDAVTRNIWAEDAEESAYNEADLRFGVRASWDTFFHWDPSGVVKGIVYKDINANYHYDEGEPGLPEITIQVGDKKVKTNKDGRYRTGIRAKSAEVSLGVDSVPKGYIFANKTSHRISVSQGETYTVDFALTTRSGVYGVVYYDVNDNGQLDSRDKLIPNVTLKIKGVGSATTNGDGTYFFDDVPEGQQTIEVELTTLPIEYLPKIKLRSTITLKEGETLHFNVPLKKKP